MGDFLTAIGLAIAIEGVVYALFPNGMKAMMRQMLDQPAPALRIAGLVAATVGVGLVWVVRG